MNARVVLQACSIWVIIDAIVSLSLSTDRGAAAQIGRTGRLIVGIILLVLSTRLVSRR